MLLQDAYTIVAEKTGLDKDSAVDKTKMIRYIKEALKEMYRRCKYITLMEENSFTTVTGTYLYYLDYRYLYGLSFRDNTAITSSNILDVYTRRRFEHDYQNPSTIQNTPTLIYPVKKVWVSAQPTSASVVTLVSTSGSDVTTYFVVVKGMSGGLEISEKVTLNGTNPVNTSASFTSVIAVTKDSTNGTVTATSNSGAVTLISLTPTQSEKSCWQIRIHPIPNAVLTYNYSFQRKPWVFDANDEDLLPFDDTFDDALTLFISANILKTQGDPTWQVSKQMAESKLAEIMDNDYFSESEDARMGLIEIDEMGDNW